MSKTGKAWVMEGPGKLDLREFPYPKCEDDGIIIKVEACGICGTDKHMFNGNAGMVDFPIIPGHEFAGVIEEIGPKYKESMLLVDETLDLKVGDRVILGPGTKGCGKCPTCLKYPDKPLLCQNRFRYGHSKVGEPPYFLGGYSQYIYALPDSWLFKVPDGMSPELAAMAEPICIALRVVERAMEPGSPSTGHGFGIGKTVAVIGAGPIGLLIMAAFKHAGAGKIIAIDMLPKKLEMAKEFGADLTIDAKLSVEERQKIIMENNGGELADVVVEAAGAPIAFKQALDFVRRGGIVIEAGHFTDGGEIPINPYTICNKDCDIRGVWANHPVTFRDALNFMDRTTVPLEKLATHIFGMNDVPEAMKTAGGPDVGKVIIKPWE